MKLEVGKKYGSKFWDEDCFVEITAIGKSGYLGIGNDGVEGRYPFNEKDFYIPFNEPALDDTLFQEVEKCCNQDFGTSIISRQIMALIKVLDIKLEALGSIRRED